MGNTSSDSLDHSFKRLRLSQTEKLSLASPSSVSPKRKLPSNNTTGLTETFNDEIENNTNDQLPTLAWHNNILSSSVNPVLATSKPIMNQLSDEHFSSSSVNPVLATSKPIMNQLSDEHFSSDEELICLMKSSIRSDIFHNKDTCTNQKPSDEEIKMNLTCTNIIPELSDDDLVACIKYAYINEKFKQKG